MHIPDGFLSTPVAATAGVVAAGAVYAAVKRSERTLDDRAVPLVGVTAAFVFAAQMLNFPVAGGTSGHLLGAALAVTLLGPSTACLVLTVVVALQAFVFADGGISALGANVVNMAVIGVATATAVLLAGRRLTRGSDAGLLAATAVAAWISVVVASGAVAVELALSGTVPMGTVLPAMLGVHALIGVGEAVVTVAAAGAVLAARPDLVWALRDRRTAPRVPRPEPAGGGSMGSVGT